MLNLLLAGAVSDPVDRSHTRSEGGNEITGWQMEAGRSDMSGVLRESFPQPGLS